MKRILSAVAVAAVLAGATARAQTGGMNNMSKFFGENKAFSAKVESTMAGPSGPMTMEMNMAMLDGKVRTEVDFSKMKSTGARAGQLQQMKQMGMDQIVNIMRPDKKAGYLIYPNMKAYAENVLTDKQAADMMDTTSKIEKTSLGKETIDGHACEKNKLIVTGENGDKHEVLTWNAKDLKDFPIQMQMTDQGNTVTMKYTDVKLEKPDVKLFEPPADFTKYNSNQSLMQGEMMKRASAGGFGAPPK